MKVMVFIKGDQASEEGVLPDAKFVAAMTEYNEQLVKSGVLLVAKGLYPSAKGKRVKFTGSQATVIDGPFTEAKELIAGLSFAQAVVILGVPPTQAYPLPSQVALQPMLALI
jgi:hypothetical protein